MIERRTQREYKVEEEKKELIKRWPQRRKTKA